MSVEQAVPADVRLMELSAAALCVGFVALMLVWLAGWASNQPVFALRAIVLGGDLAHNNAVTVRANVAPRLAGTFFTLDLARARSVFEQLPWVRRAIVRREFPNQLRVRLQEHTAVAFWGPEGESSLVNSFGEVFEANAGEVDQDTLPRLRGPQGQAASMWAMYQGLQGRFEAMDMTIEQLELTHRGGWRVRLEGGAVIELGTGAMAEVMDRTDRFLQTLTQVSSRYGRTVQALETADLRHKDGYAIRLAGVITLAPVGKDKQSDDGNRNGR